MIYRHTILKLPIFLVSSAIYIGLKFLISPLLYLLKYMGVQSHLPRKIDSIINRTILPLTEKPDSVIKMDVEPKVKNGDKLPSIKLIFPDGDTLALNEYTKKPLLIIFIRGSWCSYSRLHLSDIMSNKEELEKTGIEFLVITSYNDFDWWLSNNIDLPMCFDPDGNVFDFFGIKVESWMEYAWGRILPHESVFLFDSDGILVSKDVRKVNSILPGQRFLGSDKWLEIVHELI